MLQFFWGGGAHWMRSVLAGWMHCCEISVQMFVLLFSSPYLEMSILPMGPPTFQHGITAFPNRPQSSVNSVSIFLNIARTFKLLSKLSFLLSQRDILHLSNNKCFLSILEPWFQYLQTHVAMHPVQHLWHIPWLPLQELNWGIQFLYIYMADLKLLAVKYCIMF